MTFHGRHVDRISILYIYSFGYIKTLVYTEEIRNRDQLLQKSREATDIIRNKQELYSNYGAI